MTDTPPTPSAQAAVAPTAAVPPATAPASDPDKQQRDLQDWAEKLGVEYLKEHMANLESLKADSSSFLTILVAAGGATLAFLLNAPEKHTAPEMVWGAVVLLLYLFILGALLVAKCLTAKHAFTVSNSAVNVYQDGVFRLAELRPAEFKNMKGRADQLIARNKSTATWLNRIRYGALCSPFVFAVGYVAAVAAKHYHLFDNVAAVLSRF